MLIETYKDHEINDMDGIIEVGFPDGRRFIPALDDSKLSGRRKLIESANNIQTAREYIDLITR